MKQKKMIILIWIQVTHDINNNIDPYMNNEYVPNFPENENTGYDQFNYAQYGYDYSGQKEKKHTKRK
jgi:hypothetical protein